MKSYYLYQGDQRQGPYSIDQLKEMQINSTVPVWTEGLASWTEAQKIPELQASLFSTPPPYIPAYSGSESSATEKVGFKMGRPWKKVVGGLLVVALIVLVIKIVNSAGDKPPASSDRTAASSLPIPRPKTEAELREELRQREMKTPGIYISGSVKWRKNLVGETVVEGTLTNNATMATFKDPVLLVTWMSKTNTAMRTNQYPVYEYLGPRESVPYKLKVHGPNKYSTVSIAIKSATVVE